MISNFVKERKKGGKKKAKLLFFKQKNNVHAWEENVGFFSFSRCLIFIFVRLIFPFFSFFLFSRNESRANVTVFFLAFTNFPFLFPSSFRNGKAIVLLNSPDLAFSDTKRQKQRKEEQGEEAQNWK